MWAHEFFDEHMMLQTWAAGADVDVSDPALAPAAFFRAVLQASTPPPATRDIGALNHWARSAGFRGPVVWNFIRRVQGTVYDALTSGGGDLSLVLARDLPEGATRGERDRYLRMLGATLRAGRELGAARARVQHRRILPTDRADATDLVPLEPKHIAGRDAGLGVTLISFWRDATPGDEAVDLLLAAAHKGGARAVQPVAVHAADIGPAAGGAA